MKGEEDEDDETSKEMEDIVMATHWEDVEVESIDQDVMQVLSKGFKVYDSLDASAASTAPTTTNKMECIVENLGPGMTFQVYLVCFNAVGSSERSSIVEFQVQGCQPNPPLAPELMETDMSDTSDTSGKTEGCAISCVPMLVTNGAPIDQWRIECRKKTEKKWNVVHEKKENTMRLHENIVNGGVLYEFRAYAHNSFGWSEASKSNTFLMLPTAPSPPTRLRSLEPSSFSLMKMMNMMHLKTEQTDDEEKKLCLEWDAPENNHGASVVEYRLSIRCVQGRNESKNTPPQVHTDETDDKKNWTDVAAGKDTKHIVTGLEAGTTFAVSDLCLFLKPDLFFWSLTNLI